MTHSSKLTEPNECVVGIQIYNWSVRSTGHNMQLQLAPKVWALCGTEPSTCGIRSHFQVGSVRAELN
jgi:hypothetical protein